VATIANGETLSSAPTPVALDDALSFSAAVFIEEGKIGPATTPDNKNAKSNSKKIARKTYPKA
jgi:hypothetical protein